GVSVPSIIKVSRPEDGSATQEGEVLGTPAYMPPEQALGEVDRLDERCDVFSLGAMLCEVLTGQPPYAGNDPSAVLRKARRAERRARRLTLGLAAAVLLLVGAGGGGAWWLQEQRAAALAKQRETDDRARAILLQTGPLLVEAWRKDDIARLAECQALADKAR